jgi:hypothetical protein
MMNIDDLLQESGMDEYTLYTRDDMRFFARMVAEKCAEIAKAGTALAVSQVINERFVNE